MNQFERPVPRRTPEVCVITVPPERTVNADLLERADIGACPEYHEGGRTGRIMEYRFRIWKAGKAEIRTTRLCTVPSCTNTRPHPWA